MQVASPNGLFPGPVLGIETSCDETAAAVVRLCTPDGPAEVLSDVVWSQFEAHAPYGGVAPEIAARAHVEAVDQVVAAAMRQAALSFKDLAGVAATAGPGLIGGVMVGLMTGKAIALAHGLPLLAVNHLEAHALSPRLAQAAPFPYLLLLASGGHCQFLAVAGVGDAQRLGSTIDDAAGEAFDKAARVLGLGFPGGPALERVAAVGNPQAVLLPRPLLGRPGCDFSFAGLKSAVAREAEAAPLTSNRAADLAASFQAAVLDIVKDRTRNAMAVYEQAHPQARRLVVAGGVAANMALRQALQTLAASKGYDFCVPPRRWCTDNAAMVALTGAERLRLGLVSGLDAPARPRWPLDAEAAAARPTHAAGRKGPKA